MMVQPPGCRTRLRRLQRRGVGRTCRLSVDLERADILRKCFDLILELIRCGGGLLAAGRVVLRYLVDLIHGFIDLLQAIGLLLAGGGDLVDQGIDVARALENLAENPANLVADSHADVGVANRFLDQRSRVLGGLGAALRQRANFLSHNGEALASVTVPLLSRSAGSS